MRTATVINASKIPFVKNQLDGKSVANQISALLEMNEILTDAFSATYQSEYFRLGEKQTRFNVSALQTAFNMVTKGLIECSLVGVEIDQQIDWNRLEVNKEIDDLACDIETYLEYSSAFITVFDCFFNHDSMQGEAPQKFIEKALQTRDFFQTLLGASLLNATNKGASEKTTAYSCRQHSWSAA